MDDMLCLADWTAGQPQRGPRTTRKDVRCGCTNRVHDSRAVAYKLCTLEYGKKGHNLDMMVRKSFLHQGVQMRRLCKDSSEWSLGPWIISLGVAEWPDDIYPCARGHRCIVAQHSNENGAGAVCTEAVTHR